MDGRWPAMGQWVGEPKEEKTTAETGRRVWEREEEVGAPVHLLCMHRCIDGNISVPSHAYAPPATVGKKTLTSK